MSSTDNDKDDDGFTLIELLVAMGVFAVVMVIFTASMASFSRSTVRTLRTSTQTTQARTALNYFDKQVRSASVINQEGLVGLNWYVEYRTDAFTPSTCTQWVLRTNTHVLAYRTWITGVSATSTPSAWRTVATNVANTTTQSPFTFTASTTVVPLQRLTVNLNFQQGTGPVTTSSGTFAARNTSTSTVTNTIGATPVCKDITGWRP